jgi:cobalamin biosynthetic protein CobC
VLEHGGRLREASRRYAIPLADWVDLSTGIAPWPYPLPPLAAELWQRLPEDDDGLREAAAGYYGVTDVARILPLAGSQAAIQALPRLRATSTVSTVALPTPTYGEYAPAWRAAGHRVIECAFDSLAGPDADVVLLANPNNPDARRLDRAVLLALAARLARRDGWLIVDEAFADADATDAASLAAVAGSAVAPNVIVLRSLGKFFGLAGARVGFGIAAPALLDRLRDLLGPWPLANPSRHVAKHCLRDAPWQAAQRERLRQALARLCALLTEHGLPPSATTALFAYVPCHVSSAMAANVHDHLARRGILVRRFAAPAALRFGLPGDEAAWARLRAALRELPRQPSRGWQSFSTVSG